MTGRIEFPTGFHRVGELLSGRPPEVRDLFRDAFVLAMIADEQERVIVTRIEDGLEWLTVWAVAGDVFRTKRPLIPGGTQTELIKQVRGTAQEGLGEVIGTVKVVTVDATITSGLNFGA